MLERWQINTKLEIDLELERAEDGLVKLGMEKRDRRD